MNLNVLMLGWEFPPFNSGGLGVACQHLSESLADLGVRVSFLLPWKMRPQSKSLNFIFADEVLEILEYKAFMSGYITSDEYSRLSQEEQLVLENDLALKVLNYAQKAAKVVGKQSFDILHAHDWLTFKAGLAARQVLKRPLIAHVHSTEFDRCGGKGFGNKFCQMIEREMCHKADRILAVSHYTKGILEQEYQVSVPVSVVHNGTDMSHALGTRMTTQILNRIQNSGGKIVVFAGRFSLHKGVDYFLRAARRTLDYYPNVYFILAGSGEMEGKLVEMTASLKMTDKVLFAGFLRGEELHQLYEAADLLVLPSVSEPFGMTPLEALAHKTPVILSKQSGVIEVVPNSLRVDFWDVDEMANQMVSVLRHKSLRQELGENGHKDAANATWKKAAENVLHIYEELLNQKKAYV